MQNPLYPVDQQLSVQNPLYPVDQQLSAQNPLYPVDQQLSAQNPLYPVDQQLSAQNPLYPVDQQLSAQNPLYPVDQQLSAQNPLYPVSEKISNEDLRRTADQEPATAQIGRRKGGWIGHTLNKPASNITRQAVTWNLQGKRQTGRPRVGFTTPSGSLPTASPGRL